MNECKTNKREDYKMEPTKSDKLAKYGHEILATLMMAGVFFLLFASLWASIGAGYE